MRVVALREAEERYGRLLERALEARAARDRLIRAELEAGASHAEVARATGLTRARVGQIALRG